jgi:hypothetical protein
MKEGEHLPLVNPEVVRVLLTLLRSLHEHHAERYPEITSPSESVRHLVFFFPSRFSEL